MKYLSQKQWLPVLLCLAMLAFETLASPQLVVPKTDQLPFYINKYGGRADPENALIRRVHQVFKKVRSVADKNHKRPPRLAIVKGFNTPDDPFAISLAKGGIVISQQTINLIYKNVSRAHGDTRAAFVLGHELAHLAEDDPWHREFLGVAKESPLLPELVKNYREQNGKQKEIKADDSGFLYAAMAGYPVDKLIAEGEQQQNFFVYW